MNNKQIYLHNNATTALHPEVIKKMQELLPLFGNASSLHSFGRAAQDELNAAREIIAKGLGAEISEIIFTGSGSGTMRTAVDCNSCSYRCRQPAVIGSPAIVAAGCTAGIEDQCATMNKEGFATAHRRIVNGPVRTAGSEILAPGQGGSVVHSYRRTYTA